MANYVIITDSACDINPELLAEWGVPYRSLTFRFENEDKEYSNNDMDVKTFYDRMRAGGVAKTAAVNVEAFTEEFEKVLKEGTDILYLGFSSGLSTTFNSARLAANQLTEEYPDRKIIVVDTLSASAGFGLLLYLTLQKKNEGASIEEAAEYAKSLIFRLAIGSQSTTLYTSSAAAESVPQQLSSATCSVSSLFCTWTTKDIL